MGARAAVFCTCQDTGNADEIRLEPPSEEHLVQGQCYSVPRGPDQVYDPDISVAEHAPYNSPPETARGVDSEVKDGAVAKLDLAYVDETAKHPGVLLEAKDDPRRENSASLRENSSSLMLSTKSILARKSPRGTEKEDLGKEAVCEGETPNPAFVATPRRGESKPTTQARGDSAHELKDGNLSNTSYPRPSSNLRTPRGKYVSDSEVCSLGISVEELEVLETHVAKAAASPLGCVEFAKTFTARKAGNHIVTLKEHTFENMTFIDACKSSSKVTIVGLRHADGTVSWAPEPFHRIQGSDGVLLIKCTPFALAMGMTKESSLGESQLMSAVTPRGWSREAVFAGKSSPREAPPVKAESDAILLGMPTETEGIPLASPTTLPRKASSRRCCV